MGTEYSDSMRESEFEDYFLEYERSTGGRVVRTRSDLEYVKLDQPGPEIIASGTIGEVGLARWCAPFFDRGELVFYANLPRAKGADFVCVRYEPATGAQSTEVVDGGWFEIAADLSIR